MLSFRKISQAVALAFFLGNASAHAKDQGFTLARDGKPEASIVLSEKPTVAAQFAAYEIQQHIELITGAKLPIEQEKKNSHKKIIAIGDTAVAKKMNMPRDSFKPQEYAICFTDNAIILRGNDRPSYKQVLYNPKMLKFKNIPGFWEEQGSLYAAYDFLETTCGVRWLNPFPSGTVHPKAKTLTVKPINVRRTPAFEYRDALAAIGDHLSRYNHLTTLWPTKSMEFKNWEDKAYSEISHLKDPQKARNEMVFLFLKRMRNGGNLQRCNHSLYGYYKRFWNNPKTRDAAMFAKGYKGKPPQMCYTNPKLIKQVAQDARDYYDGKKTGKELGIFWNPRRPNIFPVEAMDNRAFCKCKKCQEIIGLHKKGASDNTYSNCINSDYFFNFVNQVVKELHKTHPDKSVMTLAYMTHAKEENIQLDPSVAVQYCPISHHLPGPRCDTEMEIAKYWSEEAKKTGRKLYLWLYYCFPAEFAKNTNKHCWPGFYAHAIEKQMRLFKKLGYKGMFHCGYGQEADAYITFKLMDNTNLKVNKLLDEYFNGLYGGAAKPMKELYLEIEKNYMKTKYNGSSSALITYSSERMDKLEGFWSKAKKLASTKREKENIDLFELSIWSYMKEGLAQKNRSNAASIESLKVPLIPSADGDVNKVDWSKAVSLGNWHQNNSDRPAKRKLSGKIAHDSNYLYIELIDQCKTAKLRNFGTVFPFDTWEIFVAGQRGLPYRQYAFNSKGTTAALAHGEIAHRMNMPLEKPAITVISDTKSPDKWTFKVAFKLSSILPNNVSPNGKLYLNIFRVSSKVDIDSWGTFTHLKNGLSRMPELILEQ